MIIKPLLRFIGLVKLPTEIWFNSFLIILDNWFSFTFPIFPPNLEVSEILNLFHEFEKNQKYKTIKNFNLPLTSIDLKGSLYCSNIDHRWTILNGKQLRIVTWYDNEIGYSTNVVNILNKINIHFKILILFDFSETYIVIKTLILKIYVKWKNISCKPNT